MQNRYAVILKTMMLFDVLTLSWVLYLQRQILHILRPLSLWDRFTHPSLVKMYVHMPSAPPDEGWDPS